ncbi:MAG: hypothetical protein IKJ91_10100 [Clostridia bacterium]|nr:hypothetical protein [Clostridia bacterium]
MKQQIKIEIARDGNSEGVFLTLPTNQKDFDRLTRGLELRAKEFKIVSTCCNNFSLHQCLMKTKNLSKINYLGSIFEKFTQSQRVLFGSISDMYLCHSLSIDDFINLARNIEKNTSTYDLFTIEIPPELKLRIRSTK